jgi:hypothetical protein
MDRAGCVGINAYPHPNALHGCLNDINDVEAAVVTVCHFDSAGVVALKDDKATAEAIKATLQRVVALLDAPRQPRARRRALERELTGPRSNRPWQVLRD